MKLPQKPQLCLAQGKSVFVCVQPRSSSLVPGPLHRLSADATGGNNRSNLSLSLQRFMPKKTLEIRKQTHCVLPPVPKHHDLQRFHMTSSTNLKERRSARRLPIHLPHGRHPQAPEQYGTNVAHGEGRRTHTHTQR